MKLMMKVGGVLRAVLKSGTLLGLILLSAFNLWAKSSDKTIERSDFSTVEALNFNFGNQKSQDNVQMSTAKVAEQFDCPLFSNSPYEDLLSSIDGLQSSINIFPKCEGADGQGRVTEVLTSLSSGLRDKVLQARELQASGDSKKLSVSAKDILSSAKQLQDFMSKMSSSSPSCYESESSKKLIFSMNDTFQSIAPLALDFVAKNPSLGASLAPFLPVVAGAQAISTGLSILELAVTKVPTLNMKNYENRIAVIKNTCAFMKVYQKVNLMTLQRAPTLLAINKDFDEKIRQSEATRKSALVSLGGMSVSSNPIDKEIMQIKERSARYLNLLGKASVELTVQKSKASEISSCSVVKTIYAMKLSKNLLQDITRLAEIFKREDDVAFKKTKLEEFENVMDRPDTLKSPETCSEMGQEWLNAQNEALNEVQQLLVDYDASLQRDPQQLVALQQVAREEKKQEGLKANRVKINLFADMAVLAPGEVAKRMAGLPGLLFNNSSYNKNGPVYDLMMNNEEYFKAELKAFNQQISILQTIERRYAQIEFSKVKNKTPIVQNEFYMQLIKNDNELPHLTPKYIAAGTDDYKEVCETIERSILSYVTTADHLISNEFLCKMIDPALGEPTVSKTLYRYCRNAKSMLVNTTQLAGYVEMSRPLFVENGPRDKLAVLIKRKAELACKSRSNFIE